VLQNGRVEGTPGSFFPFSARKHTHTLFRFPSAYLFAVFMPRLHNFICLLKKELKAVFLFSEGEFSYSPIR